MVDDPAERPRWALERKPDDSASESAESLAEGGSLITGSRDDDRPRLPRLPAKLLSRTDDTIRRRRRSAPGLGPGPSGSSSSSFSSGGCDAGESANAAPATERGARDRARRPISALGGVLCRTAADGVAMSAGRRYGPPAVLPCGPRSWRTGPRTYGRTGRACYLRRCSHFTNRDWLVLAPRTKTTLLSRALDGLGRRPSKAELARAASIVCSRRRTLATASMSSASNHDLRVMLLILSSASASAGKTFSRYSLWMRTTYAAYVPLKRHLSKSSARAQGRARLCSHPSNTDVARCLSVNACRHGSTNLATSLSRSGLRLAASRAAGEAYNSAALTSCPQGLVAWRGRVGVRFGRRR